MSLTLTATPPTSSPCRAHDLESRLAKIADAGPAAVEDRLNQLDWEWTAGRMTKVATGVIVLAGVALTAATGSWWWIAMTVVGGLFLLEYSFSRTSVLGRLFSEMGYRSGCEVEQEKFALKTLRGDFRHLPTLHDIEDKDDITRLEGEGGIVVDQDAQKVDSREAVREVVQATS